MRPNAGLQQFRASHGNFNVAGFRFNAGLKTLNTLNTLNTSTLPTNHGIVIKKNQTIYTVQTDGRLLECTLAGRMLAATGRAQGKPRQPLQHHPESLAIGDAVAIQPGETGRGLIVDLLPRRNQLSRRSAVPMPTAHAHEQVIAANLDQVIPVFAAAQPAPKWNLLDRYLAAVETAGLDALICITKLDLVRDRSGALDSEIQAAVDDYRRIGYPVILASAHSGEGLDELRSALQGRLSVLLGKSGVGKTSLLNALQPGLGLRVHEVSQVTGKGRHTTTSLELFSLDFGGGLIDTPGVREFGLWEFDPQTLDECYPEMRPYLGQCRFGLDCAHDEEPGCSVRQAVMEGAISPRRYQSYLRLRSSEG